MKLTVFIISILTIFSSTSCLKDKQLYRDDERSFNAVVMQNKIHDTWSFTTGHFYGIHEYGKTHANTLYGSIAGFDHLYVVGYQYKVKIHEVCRSYSRIGDGPMDTTGCKLFLIQIYGKEKVDEEFIVKNPYENN